MLGINLLKPRQGINDLEVIEVGENATTQLQLTVPDVELSSMVFALSTSWTRVTCPR